MAARRAVDILDDPPPCIRGPQMRCNVLQQQREESDASCGLRIAEN